MLTEIGAESSEWNRERVARRWLQEASADGIVEALTGVGGTNRQLANVLLRCPWGAMREAATAGLLAVGAANATEFGLELLWAWADALEASETDSTPILGTHRAAIEAAAREGNATAAHLLSYMGHDASARRGEFSIAELIEADSNLRSKDTSYLADVFEPHIGRVLEFLRKHDAWLPTPQEVAELGACQDVELHHAERLLALSRWPLGTRFSLSGPLDLVLGRNTVRLYGRNAWGPTLIKVTTDCEVPSDLSHPPVLSLGRAGDYEFILPLGAWTDYEASLVQGLYRDRADIPLSDEATLHAFLDGLTKVSGRLGA